MEAGTLTREEIERAARLALWYEELIRSSNESFLPLLSDDHRYLVLKGGAGSGKSIFAGRKVLERVTSEPGHRWLVARKVARTIRESCFSQLLGQIAEHYPDSGARINRTDMAIRFPNGSEILFTGLDDTEKLKSIYNITGIWIEEASELTESDFNQLDIRLRGETPFYKQIILSFNPVSIKHWLKERFFDRADPRVRTHESTYRDNRFLDAAAIETLESFRETDEYFYTVYCLGMWGSTGRSVFDSRAVNRRLQEDLRPQRVGYFEFADDGRSLRDIRWVDDEQGFIRIWAEPEPGVPYVIGGDPAGEGSDSFVAQVLDNRSGRQVCTLRHSMDEDLYAKQVCCLGLHYNTALVGLETNFSTYPVRELERLRYPKQYVREQVDDYTHSLRRSFGFRTDSKTRPVIISELIKAVRDDISIVSDETTLQEMLTFVRGEDWKPTAESGAHDDCVMALAIAHYIRPQQRYDAQSPERERVRWTESMWEDYRRADRATREYLLEKWGRPASEQTAYRL